MTYRTFVLPSLLVALATARATDDENKAALSDPRFFPIAVWLQDPGNAPRYKDMGINVYVGLWRGPTEKQLALRKKHGMRVICAQNAVGLQHKGDPTILAWMHGDEPDNAQTVTNCTASITAGTRARRTESIPFSLALSCAWLDSDN
jgi:hypothetical protein